MENGKGQSKIFQNYRKNLDYKILMAILVSGWSCSLAWIRLEIVLVMQPRLWVYYVKPI